MRFGNALSTRRHLQSTVSAMVNPSFIEHRCTYTDALRQRQMRSKQALSPGVTGKRRTKVLCRERAIHRVLRRQGANCLRPAASMARTRTRCMPLRTPDRVLGSHSKRSANTYIVTIEKVRACFRYEYALSGYAPALGCEVLLHGKTPLVKRLSGSRVGVIQSFLLHHLHEQRETDVTSVDSEGA